MSIQELAKNFCPRTQDQLARAQARAEKDCLICFARGEGMWLVPSLSGNEYLVVSTGPHFMNLRCTCPAGTATEEGLICKHIVCVMIAREEGTV